MQAIFDMRNCGNKRISMIIKVRGVYSCA